MDGHGIKPQVTEHDIRMKSWVWVLVQDAIEDKIEQLQARIAETGDFEQLAGQAMSLQALSELWLKIQKEVVLG